MGCNLFQQGLQYLWASSFCSEIVECHARMLKLPNQLFQTNGAVSLSGTFSQVNCAWVISCLNIRELCRFRPCLEYRQ